ncbi:bifunctional indole-3-glycerol-phosphate synthase TrpC/phosphoribosylanthranilate isomerase TrpF [Shewanella sp. A3A]|nr:bifunctional indole-3-glycerol-phosphate synthase TrpC/phosphoribosylanthranilate isomerase TrpF [Shewanella ferrihydritica]
MSNVLTKIVDTKAAHIESLKARFPEESLNPKISTRSLYQALSGDKAGFILECKKASPSKGLIRDDFDPIAIAEVYSHYASAVSVLTDEEFFQGDMAFLPMVRTKVDQPILCKDFFVSPYQVKLAAHQGADAILLMLSVLDDEQYQLLAAEAAKYQLDTLTEISNEEELARAIALQAPIVGINNRNLRDLSTHIETTERLAPQLPDGMLVISESGIYTHQDVRRLSPLVNGFLVGSSLMSEDDLDLACRKLLLGHHKVCGLTRAEDIAAAADAGAIYGGLIFAEKSPRKVSIDQAKALAAANSARQRKLQLVGVFVNERADVITELAASLDLAAVQLHGEETEHDITAIKQALTKARCLNTEVWKAIPVSTEATTEIAAIPANADRLLFDSKNASGFGGTGARFDWSQSLPNKAQAMLAGGLSAANAEDAANAGFYGLDFNSGVETAPGIKDAPQIIAALTAVRA